MVTSDTGISITVDTVKLLSEISVLRFSFTLQIFSVIQNIINYCKTLHHLPHNNFLQILDHETSDFNNILQTSHYHIILRIHNLATRFCILSAHETFLQHGTKLYTITTYYKHVHFKNVLKVLTI